MMMNLGRCPSCRLVGGGCCVADRLLLVPEERNKFPMKSIDEVRFDEVEGQDSRNHKILT